MRSGCLFLLLFLLASPPTAAQAPGRLAGTVRDATTGQPVSAAQVRLTPGGHGVITSRAGAFTFVGLEPGTYTLSVQALGYTAQDVQAEVGTGSAVVTIDVAVAPLPLDPLTAEASARPAELLELGGFWSRRERGVGQFFTRADIEASDAIRFVDLMRRVPGVRIDRMDAIGEGHIVSFRRAAVVCAAVVYVDGVVFPLTEAGHDLIRLDEVEAIEAYSGPARLPPQFNQTGAASRSRGLPQASPSCGVLVVWTRRGARSR